MLPFEEKQISETIKIRTFKQSTLNEELIWHRDAEDRSVRVLKGEGWYFQRDNDLPDLMMPNKVYFIKKCTWHRVIRKKDCSELVVEITKLL